MTTSEKLGVGCCVLLIVFGVVMLLGGTINYVEKPAENPLLSTVALMGLLGVARRKR